jgi:hypothetical protein
MCSAAAQPGASFPVAGAPAGASARGCVRNLLGDVGGESTDEPRGFERKPQEKPPCRGNDVRR